MNVRRCSGVAALLGSIIAVAGAQPKRASGEWQSYGGDKGFNRYSPLSQINRDNIKNLRVVWRRPAVDPLIMDKFPDLSPSNYFRGTPVFINGVLYAPDGVGLVEAFDAATGHTLWVQQPVEPTLKEAAGQSTRGVAYWRKDADERLISIRRDYLYAMDAKTGKPRRDFGENGRVWLSRHTPDDAGYFGFPGPFVVNDVIVVGGNGGGKTGEGYGDDGFESHSTPEDIRGYDIHSGKLIWTFHVLPRKGEPGYETWGKGSAELYGQHGGLGFHDSRRTARLCLRAIERAHGVLLWRPSAGQQPVLGFLGGAERQNRQSGVVLPDGPSRSLGLRLGYAAGAGRHYGGRQADQSRDRVE